MIGAIIGDIVGSRFELNNHKSKDFELFTPECRFTDDTVMTLAICDALLSCDTAGNFPNSHDGNSCRNNDCASTSADRKALTCAVTPDSLDNSMGDVGTSTSLDQTTTYTLYPYQHQDIRINKDMLRSPDRGSVLNLSLYQRPHPDLFPGLRSSSSPVTAATALNHPTSCTSTSDKLARLTVQALQRVGRRYPDCGYGASFKNWLQSSDPHPYHSYGNGAAMRVSGCAYAAGSLQAVTELSYQVTAVTHNHIEGLKGAEATAVAVYLARTGMSQKGLYEYIATHYYSLDFTLDQIRDSYRFEVSCQGSVPQAFAAFFEADSFEDAIRNAISIGGDSDTIAAITGSLAEAYYEVPLHLRQQALRFLDDYLKDILFRFEQHWPTRQNRQS